MSTITVVPEGTPGAYTPYGGCREFMNAKDKLIFLAGSTGSGKTTSACWKMHLLCQLYPGCKFLFTRNSYRALLKSGVETYERVVRDSGMSFGKLPHQIKKMGETEPREYRYPYARREVNGKVYEGQSRILISSLSNARDELGAEYDFIYVNQPEQASEEDWQFLSSRLRYGHAAYHQMFGDPNPEHKQHWINLGGYYVDSETGDKTGLGDRWRLIKSTYHDNPVLWDRKLECFTEKGEEYVGGLIASLNPVMRKRLVDGEWCSFEGLVYGEVWDRGLIIDDRELASYGIDDSWPRYWAIDHGFNPDPFVLSFIAKHPLEEFYVRYKLIYMSNRTITEHAQTIRNVTLGEPLPKLIVADRNPELNTTLSRELGLNIITAKKGAGSVEARINILTDILKKRQIRFFNEALVEVDQILVDRKVPIGFENEVENIRRDEKKNGTAPIDGDDHEENALGYLFTYLRAVNKPVEFLWG